MNESRNPANRLIPATGAERSSREGPKAEALDSYLSLAQKGPAIDEDEQPTLSAEQLAFAEVLGKALAAKWAETLSARSASKQHD
jgi:hypothetical protein